jgi:hypothetical protein
MRRGGSMASYRNVYNLLFFFFVFLRQPGWTAKALYAASVYVDRRG